jgi:5-methylcytosine-specific restriction protein B
LRPDVSNQGTGTLSFILRDGVFKRIADRALENYKAFKQKTDKNRKPPFRKVFDAFIQPLENGDVDEIDVKMSQVSFFINQVSEKSIFFRKQTGDSKHSLSIGTLSEMYEKESIDKRGGLGIYYKPLLDKLLASAKTMSVDATTESLKNYVLIIDEINRANMSRVFGELITLLEDDKRFDRSNEMTATLPSGEKFTVPPNLFVIGTMNTADKSIALIDVALRRRFAFKKMYPDASLVKSDYRALFESLNTEIVEQKGADFQIGHSFFMDTGNIPFNLTESMNNKIIPLLYEYFMNDGEAVKNVLGKVGVELKSVMGLYEFVAYNNDIDANQ